jgi:trimethylamine--corrinoid protein Co-methyltransferase
MTDMPLVGQTEGVAMSNFSIDLAEAANGRCDVPVMAGICNSLSPMAWDERMLEGIEVFAQRGQALNISCCSMCGATAPVYLMGGIVEANCEVLGGLVYSQLIKPGTPVIYGTTSSVMDMGTMALALGAPEYSLISAACAQMAKRYHLPFRGGGGLTDAKELDAQAGMESTWNLLISLMEGVNFMLQSVGILESFMSVAFDKWVFDEEVISRAKRLLRGLGQIPPDLAEVMAKGVSEGGFLKQKSTLKNFRREFYIPTLGDRRNYESYHSRGKTMVSEAWEVVKKRLASYEYPQLEPQSLAALNTCFKRATGEDPPKIS